MSLLRINSLSVRVPNSIGNNSLLQQVSLNISAGEIVGIVGESGAGKSTLCSAIVGLMPSPNHLTSGSVEFKGQDITILNRSNRQIFLGRKIASIFQDTKSSLDPLLTVSQQLLETIQQLRMTLYQSAYEEAISLLKLVGFDDPTPVMRAYPHNLSGGMLQRVVIALAISGQPELIVADEPTSALSKIQRARILTLFRDLASTKNTATLLVSHDIASVALVADRVLVFRSGTIVDEGTTAQILSRYRGAYTKSLVGSIRKSPRSLVKAWEHLLEGKDIGFSYKSPSKFFSGAKSIQVLNGVSFVIARGQTLGLVGPNGSGKSTLAKIICGILKPTSGSMIWHGHDSTAHPSKNRVQMIFQNPLASLNPKMSAFQLVAEPIKFLQLTDNSKIEETVAEYFESVGLDFGTRFRMPRQFSGGQCQRIAIARALAARPNVLVCDEPTSSLDKANRTRILTLLKTLQQKSNMAMLIISHDEDLIVNTCDRVLALEDGYITEC